MKQQVNLYQPIFRKQRIVFSAQTMLWVGLGFLLLLVAYAFLMERRVAHLEDQLQRQLQAEQQAVTRLARLRESLPPAQPSPELRDDVARLEQRRDNLRASVNMLRARIPETRTRLRPPMEALGRRHPDGLWLTGVEVAEGGRHLELRGRALSAELVPAYIEALAGEPATKGLSFQQIRISTAKTGEPGVEFMVSTETVDGEGS